MRVRKRYLPPGWYPAAAEEIERDIASMRVPGGTGPANGIAGVVPHAGWEYSGAVAFAVFSGMVSHMDTIVIVGGHLGPADGIMCSTEDGYETPLGTIAADTDLLDRLRALLPMREDRYADNTVEVQLPFIRHCFPSAKALGLRASPSAAASRLGEAVFQVARDLKRTVAVVGSTDLTHYGPNYGFAPAGSGKDALRWVTEVNDRRLIDRMLALDIDGAMERSLQDRSACSAGGALAAMAFARASGISTGTLVRYMTSADIHPSASFVGYAGILYARPA